MKGVREGRAGADTVRILQLEMVTDTFNKLVSSCHAKCISQRFAEPDLNKGESVCIDRCVSKFFLVNKAVSNEAESASLSSAKAKEC